MANLRNAKMEVKVLELELKTLSETEDEAEVEVVNCILQASEGDRTETFNMKETMKKVWKTLELEGSGQYIFRLKKQNSAWLIYEIELR